MKNCNNKSKKNDNRTNKKCNHAPPKKERFLLKPIIINQQNNKKSESIFKNKKSNINNSNSKSINNYSSNSLTKSKKNIIKNTNIFFIGGNSFSSSQLNSISKKTLSSSNKLPNNSSTKIWQIKNNTINDPNKRIFMRISCQKNINNEILEYLAITPDEMDYDDAIKKDKRTFCQFFLNKLQNNQLIANTFCNSENTRPITIKILLFILNIELYIVINAMFYNDRKVSEIYNADNEKENFFSFMPRSIENIFKASLVGVIISYVIEFFFVEEKKIKRIFKREKDYLLQLRYEIATLLDKIKSLYIAFIIVSFVISIFSWIYLSCFNFVYSSLQTEWIKSSVFVIIFIQMYEVFLCFCETTFRFLSFRCKSEKVFKMSKKFS